jgi:hypothetical protein
MENSSHYYILPDGTRAENMKEACQMMHIYGGLFRRLLKHGEIKRQDTSNTNSNDITYKQIGESQNGNNL